VAGVHEAGGAMFLQLWAPGRGQLRRGRGQQPGLRRAEPVGPVASGRDVRPRRHGGRAEQHQARLRPGRAGRRGDRRRRRRTPLGPRLPARPVLVAGDQPAHRPLRRAFDHRSRDVRRRGGRGGARGDRP
jgi:hypothetical protein